MLNITKTIENETACVALEGRLDSVSAPVLEKDLTVSLENVKDLTLDLGKLDYVSSAGLRVLLGTQKLLNTREGKMKLTHVCDTIMEILDVTGLSGVLTIE